MLFDAKDKPYYLPGLRVVMGLFAGLLVIVGAQVLCLVWLNKVRESQRVAAGKPAKIVDTSMSNTYVAGDASLGQNGGSMLG